LSFRIGARSVFRAGAAAPIAATFVRRDHISIIPMNTGAKDYVPLKKVAHEIIYLNIS